MEETDPAVSETTSLLGKDKPERKQPTGVYQNKYFKLTDVVDEIAEAIANPDKRAKFNSMLKFSEDENKSTFPFQFSSPDVAYRTRYKIMQYLHAKNALDIEDAANNTKQYLDGLNTLLHFVSNNDKDLQAKIYRQLFLNDPQYRTTKAAREFLVRMKSEFSPEIYQKRFSRFDSLLKETKKAAKKTFVESNNPQLSIKQVVSVYAGEVYEKASYVPQILFTEAGKHFARFGENFGKPAAAGSLGAGLFVGMGFVVTSFIAAVVGVLSLSALLPGIYSFVAKPIARHTNAMNEIRKDDDKVQSMTEAKDRAVKEMVTVYVEKTATISSIPQRIHRYTSDINTNPKKGLSGLSLFKPAKEHVEAIEVSGYQNPQPQRRSGNNNNGA